MRPMKLRPMKLNTGLRIAIVVCVLALALTAAYYYGTARAASVVALPAEITLGNSSTTATTGATTAAPATTAGPATTTPVTNTSAATNSTTGTTGSTPTNSTAKPSTKSSSTPTTAVQRHVVTTVWDWNCNNSSWGSGRGGM